MDSKRYATSSYKVEPKDCPKVCYGGWCYGKKCLGNAKNNITGEGVEIEKVEEGQRDDSLVNDKGI